MFSSVSTIWVLIAAALVFFMQAGFAMVETGFTRAKNAGNIIMKNLMDFSVGSVAFWLTGFGIMFGGSSLIFGGIDLFTTGNYDWMLPSGVPLYAFAIFQTVFCATAATIVSGAMAERTKFISYIIYSLIISAVVYPISGHWVWGGGWLAEMGFHDFAGSTVVHMVGGVAALVGAKILGPRIGKYGKDGKPKAILGHSLTLGALGVFILWFGWFGFNGGSTVGAAGDETLVAMSTIFFNTNLAAATAAIAVMVVTWIRYKKPDVSMTLNGALGGLVAITAGCDAVNAFGAAAIGTTAGVVLVFGIELIDRVMKIDDPVGAIGVHGICGALGTILTGVFSTSEGLLYGFGASLLLVQVIGVGSVAAWVAVTMTIVFKVLKATVGLRCSAREEIAGLDSAEHGLSASYADFMPSVHLGDARDDKTEMEVAVPVELRPLKGLSSDTKITKVEIIANESKFEALKSAMAEIGITGMTVSKVMGCGVQKGQTEYYRGAAVDINLLPKILVEIVVSKIPVQMVVDSAKKALYTGHIGDGKIFIYNVENVIKVRTGEEGFDALQDEEE